ncbi:MAG: hypothetical protein ACPW61_05015 [Methyloligella sp. ZOD6]
MTIDENFYAPRRPVGIVAVGDRGEALLLRAILENLGAAVSLHLPGTPEDFLKVIGQGASAAPVLLVSGHGDEAGFVFGEYAPEIDVSALAGGRLGPEAIATRTKLPGTVVISTACATGSEAFGSAFLKGGASAYIAPPGYPDGAYAALFVHRLMHGVMRKGLSLQDAFGEAQPADAGDGRFALHSSAHRAET